jgi:hypothetical protein
MLELRCSLAGFASCASFVLSLKVFLNLQSRFVAAKFPI